jgi:hypothetical protein
VRIVHVAPTPFGAGGLLGGGERYPLEPARAPARDADVDLVTFRPRAGTLRHPSGLRVRTLRPVHELFTWEACARRCPAAYAELPPSSAAA